MKDSERAELTRKMTAFDPEPFKELGRKMAEQYEKKVLEVLGNVCRSDVMSDDVNSVGELKWIDVSANSQKDNERMLKWFAYEHLPPDLRTVSQRFYVMAFDICSTIEHGPERTVALRKLLEAKDAAVRAKLHPGG